MKKPASKVAEPAQIQPKSQFLFHKNLPPRDFSIMTLGIGHALKYRDYTPRVIITYHLFIIYFEDFDDQFQLWHQAIDMKLRWHFKFKKTSGFVCIVILISICSAKKGKVGSCWILLTFWITNMYLDVLEIQFYFGIAKTFWTGPIPTFHYWIIHLLNYVQKVL